MESTLTQQVMALGIEGIARKHGLKVASYGNYPEQRVVRVFLDRADGESSNMGEIALTSETLRFSKPEELVEEVKRSIESIAAQLGAAA